MSPVRVLLDTDIGTNVDDAVALWYLLHEPACELLGVTTVTGRPALRAALARAICADAGRPDVPVVAGSAEPLEGTQRQTDVPLADEAALSAFRGPAIGDGSNRNDAGKETGDDAVEFLARTIGRYPGEVVLVAIGPLTHVARLHRERPGALAALRAIFAMMGRFDGAIPRRDTNLELDPVAARMVVGSSGVRVSFVGLDATEAARFSEAELRCVLGDVARTTLASCVARWFLTRQEAVLHDLLTACAAIHPERFAWRPAEARVAPRAAGDPRLGLDARGAGRHRVMVRAAGESIRWQLREMLERRGG